MADPMNMEQLLRLLRRPEEAESPVTEGGSPFTLVAVAPEDGGAIPETASELNRAGRVVVGIGRERPHHPAPAVLDVALCRGPNDGAVPDGWVASEDPDAAAERIASTCEENPRAAAALVQLLRVTEAQPIEIGLAAESFAYSMLLAGPEFRRWLRARPAIRHRPAEDPVLVDGDERRVTLTLNRPDVRNAYDAAMRDALVDVLRSIASADPHPEVVLRGAGPAFCSGGDLSEFGTAADPVVAHGIRMARAPGPLLRRLGTTAHVHGACVGAGVELPAFCSRVVAAPDSTFLLPEVAMGLVPGAGGTASITARVGRQRTAYLALTAAAISTRLALAWGLVDAIEPA